MNDPIRIVDDVYWVGVNDLETHLFENLWPLPKGISYNSYFIKDEKNILIDTVKGDYFDKFINKVQSLLDNKNLDFLIVNHMEPDHSGSIGILLKMYPQMKIIGNIHTAKFLKQYYSVPDSNIKVIKDNEILKIGKYNLSFHTTPMVHWPETMMTYLEKHRLIFTGDAFGAFGSLNGKIFDDELNPAEFYSEAIRYYSNIVGRYSMNVQLAFKKLKNIDIKIIASTHGPIWKNNPNHIIDLYDKWSQQETEKKVVIAYGTMYGNTKIIAEKVAEGIANNGVKKIEIHNVSKSSLSYIIKDIWDSKGIVLGSCTYNTELFPLMKSLVSALNNRQLKNRFLGIFGSYTWSGGALKELEEYSNKCGLKKVLPSIEVQGSPYTSDLEEAFELGKNIAMEIIK
jgi:flavorubredoxin